MKFICIILGVFSITIYAHGRAKKASAQEIAATRIKFNPNDPNGFCISSVHPGFCIGKTVVRYAYNFEEEKCVSFNYTGCGGAGGNRFDTMEECQKRCELKNNVNV